MYIDKVLPIQYEEMEVLEENAIAFTNVEFTEDFGIFKKGDKIFSLEKNEEIGLIREYYEDGTKSGKEQLFVCKPI